MGKIPADAAHWDSGDWIAWHRKAEDLELAPCISPAEDDSARLTALHVSLLRAARAYHTLTGHHLPLYDAIAQVHAALHFGLPLNPDATRPAPVQIVHIPPHGPTNMAVIDLTLPCSHVLVVRIRDNFAVDARMIARKALPDQAEAPFEIRWTDLPLPP